MSHPFARIAAIVLLAWQALVLQAHGHHVQGPAALAPLVAAHGSTQLHAPEGRRDVPAECPICREIAHAGQYLAPGPVLYEPPVVTTPTLARVIRPASGRDARSHSWRSRAPPIPPIS